MQYQIIYGGVQQLVVKAPTCSRRNGYLCSIILLTKIGGRVADCHVKTREEKHQMAESWFSCLCIEEIVTKKKLLNDLNKLTEFHHTGELEQYHLVLPKYAPKREHFSYNGMVARTQLALLDHN